MTESLPPLVCLLSPPFLPSIMSLEQEERLIRDVAEELQPPKQQQCR